MEDCHLNTEDPITVADCDTSDICLECGALCCKLGGVVATKNEVDAIISRGYQNHFIQISDDVYGMKWGEEGICAYLDEGMCTIYPVRPLGCRMFPVVETNRNDIVLIHCPLSYELSEEKRMERKRILLNRPKSILEKSKNLRNAYIHNLRMRASKYKYRRL